MTQNKSPYPVCRYATILSLLVTALLFSAEQTHATGGSEEFKKQWQVLTNLAEPPPISARALAMARTNTLGSIETRIYHVEKWDLKPVEKGQLLLKMLAEAKPEDQRKLAHAAVKHIASTNFSLIRKHLLDPSLPRPVLSAFMTDTLQRKYDVKLPVLLMLANLEGHPMRAEARELLHGYTGRELGSSWDKSIEALMAWLTSNPR